MSQDNNLLYSQDQKPKGKPKLLVRGLLYILLLVLFGACVLFGLNVFKTYHNQVQQKEVVKVPNNEEALKNGEKLANFYKNESAPSLKNATSSQNYGLEAPKSTLLPKGRFVFSGKQLGASVGPYIRTFTLNLEDVTEGPKILFPEHQLSGMVKFENVGDTSKLFLLATSVRSMAEEQDKVGVNRYDSKTKILQSFKSTQGTNERNFAWSAKKKLLAFNRMKTKPGIYVDLLPLENWETVIFKPDTDEVVRIINGAYQPQWSPDGSKLIYLKVDGLYEFALDSNNETKVVSIPEGGLVTATSMMALSPDGSKLLWTTAKAGVISLFKIDSWDTFAIAEIGRMQIPETEFYWPVFSPDGAFYAIQAIDQLKGDDLYRKNPRIEIRPTMSRTISLTYPITNFNFDQLFSDTWIQ